MKDAVLLKSFPNGISLILNEDADFQTIIQEVAFKFSEARNFFKNASMVLSIEGRRLDSAQEDEILQVIKENSSVNIVCLIGHDEEKDGQFLRALGEMEQALASAGEGRFYKGTLKNREILETDTSIVILGDVYPGSAVISKKNIYVLGGLYGEAHAGSDGAEDAYVMALELEPERLMINDVKLKSTKQSKWGIHPKIQPKIAYIKDERIVTEPLTKELLSSL